MKVTKYENDKERRFLEILIGNDVFAGFVASKWSGHLFLSSESNKIAKWCVDHFKKENKALGSGIIAVHEMWVEKDHPTDEDSDRIAQLINSLNWENTETENISLLKEQFGTYVRKVNLTNLQSGLASDLEAGLLDKADERVSKHTQFETSTTKGVAVFNDEESIISTFQRAEEGESLVPYKGGLRDFFHLSLQRGQFIAFTGPQKSGKSFWCLDLGYRGFRWGRHRVLYIQVGDLSEQQILERIHIRNALHPLKTPTGSWPCELRKPIEIFAPKTSEGIAKVTIENISFDGPLLGVKALKSAKDLLTKDVRSNQLMFMLQHYPEINALGIRQAIESLVLSGWAPDIVVVDYADNLSACDKKEDKRDQINTNWRILSQIRLEFHLLMVTATQVKASGFNKRVLTRVDFSDDNRKFNHVSSFVGINVDAHEKEKGICRLNWVMNRDKEYNVYRCCHCAGNLGLSHPSMVSIYPKYEKKEVKNDEDNE